MLSSPDHWLKPRYHARDALGLACCAAQHLVGRAKKDQIPEWRDDAPQQAAVWSTQLSSITKRRLCSPLINVSRVQSGRSFVRGTACCSRSDLSLPWGCACPLGLFAAPCAGSMLLGHAGRARPQHQRRAPFYCKQHQGGVQAGLHRAACPSCGVKTHAASLSVSWDLGVEIWLSCAWPCKSGDLTRNQPSSHPASNPDQAIKVASKPASNTMT